MDAPNDADVPDEDAAFAAEQALFSDLDALMARMTPEQRAQFEAEMNGTDEMSEEEPQSAEADETESDEDEITAECEAAAACEENTQTVRSDAQEPVAAESVAEMESAEESPVSAEAGVPDTEQDPVTDEVPEDEVYTAAEEDEDYDLSDAEAFRALEARMTPEQRAQFEQALAEAQEAERAEKAARREARRAAQEAAAQETDAAEITVVIPDETDFSESETSEGELPTEEAYENVEVTVVALTEEHMEDAVIGETGEEAIAVELPPEETERDGVQITPTAQEDIPEQSTIFMAVGEDDDEDDMPAIRVGSDPSSFTLVIEPEPEEESEPEPTEEEMLADLLARMTPEQLARFREEMFADEADDAASEALEADTDEAIDVRDDTEIMTQEPETVSAEEYHAFAGEETSTVYAEDSSAYEETIEDDSSDLTSEALALDDASDVSDEEDDNEDAIAAVLNDPEKLEELMSRLSPEQAAELRAMLGTDEAEEAEELTERSDSETDEVVPELIADTDAEEPTGDLDGVDEEAEILSDEEEEASFAAYAEDTDEEPSGDTDDGVAFEYSRSMDEEESDEDLENEEDMNVFEINNDMSDEEISLMLGLGYEKELVYTLGADRVEQVKKRAARENARDPEFANAYAYEGEEYRSTDQNERIRYRYEVERRRLWVRLIGTSVFALLLFLYECCGLFRGAFGDIFNAAHYPVIAIMTGWQLLIFAAAFSWKQLLHGIRSAFVLEPDHHAMTAISVVVVMFSNILMAIVFKGSNLYVYNFPAAICLLCSVLCDLADVTREILTFDVVSSDAQKYVSEAITLTSAHTSMPIMSTEEEDNNALSSKNAMYVRRVGFVKNYFRRTNRKTHHAQILNFVFLPLLAFAVVMGVVTALIGNGIVPAISGFVVSILLCMPLSYTVIHTLPLLHEARRLHKQGCAIVGEGTVEECNQFPTVVFEDKDLFPPMLITTKGLKLYENNHIYSVILKISLLFREIGGPINEVLDLDKEELKRFLASGRAGALENEQVWLDSVTEDGVTARLSDGSRVVAGSASFLSAHGIYVRVSEKDQQLIDSKELSILFLAFDGKLGARFYVDYRPDPEFEALAGMLHEDGFRVAVRTLDPGIYEEMIARKCSPEMPEVGTVRAKSRELTSKTGHDAKVDGGLVCSDDPRRMLLPLRAIRNLRRLNRFSLRLYAIALLINMAVVVVLTACSAVGFMSSLFVSLYMLVWLATSLVTTALFLNK
jgi:hypothetical protein